ncbi:MAG: protein kinase [bacterium]
MDVCSSGHSFEQGYKIKEIITRDALFTIYLAEDLKQERLCFIQEFENHHPDRETAFKTFEEEFSRLKSLQESRLISLYDYFSQDEKVYLVTETFSGKSLQEIVSGAREPLAEIECIDMALKVCQALKSMKARTDAHFPLRILDPASLVLTSERDIRIVDYGLWAIFNPAWDPAAPGMEESELLTNMGKILYYCLTRTDPWSGSAEALPPPRVLNPELSPGMETLLNRCLTAGGETPYSSIEDLCRDLGSVKTYGALVVPETIEEWSNDVEEPPQEKPPSRKRTDVLVIVLGLVLILGFLAFYKFWETRRNQETKKPEIFYSTVYAELFGIHEGTMWANFYSKSALTQMPTLIQINPAGSTPRLKPSQLPVPPGNIVRLLPGSSGNTWFHSTSGLFLLKDRKLNNLAVPEFSNIALDRKGNLWASNESGFAVYNGKSWQRYLLLPSRKVVAMDGRKTYPKAQNLAFARSIIIDDSGRLWRTVEDGIVCADRKSWKKYSFASDLKNGELSLLFLDSRKRLWAAGKKSDRPFIQKFTNNRWLSIPLGKTAGSGGIRQILEDTAKKRLLFVAINGWYELKGDRLAFQPISSLPGYTPPYILDALNSVAFDEKNTMWLSCFEILLRYDGVSWKAFPVEDIYKPL